MGGKLTPAQKKIIRDAVKNNPDIRTADDLSIKQWDKIVELHDTEVLYQETNYYMEKLREKE